MTKLYQHVPILGQGARDSTTTFALAKEGDVHLTWENEALREVGESKGELEVVYPPVSILAEPSVTWVDVNVEKHQSAAASKAYLAYLFTDAAQEIFAKAWLPADQRRNFEQASGPAAEDRAFSGHAGGERLGRRSGKILWRQWNIRDDPPSPNPMSLPFNLRFNYNADTARRDLVAGATVAAIAIPQAMAYALIAGVDPRFGLYSAIVVTLVASIFGSSSHLINGPTNAISLVVFSSLIGFDARFDAYQAMFLLGVMVGVTQILIAVFKLGDLTRYISESVVLGFMAGAGLLVAIGQVGNFLGVAKTGGGGHSVLVHLWETVTQSGPYNLLAIGLGLGTLLAALLLRRVINKYKLPQMDMLVALIVASVVATFFGWSTPKPDGKTIISVIGTVPAALPFVPYPGN